MLKKFRETLFIALLSVIPTILVWLPFYLRVPTFWRIPLPQNGMATIVSNYDGPLYLVVAKSLYRPELIKTFFEFPLPVEYYAAHFPLYPLLVRAVSTVTGYPYATLLVTVSSSVLALYFFHEFTKKHMKPKEALFVTMVFAILPARWLIVRSVGSPEPLFIAAVIASVHYFQNKKYWLAGLWGAVAQLTKSPGILLFVAYALYLTVPHFKSFATTKLGKWVKSFEFRAYPILLIPLALLLVFTLYSFTLKDFFAYFNSGDNIHLFFPPFQSFNYSAPWVGTFWLEEIIFIYLIGALGLANLVRAKEGVLPWFVGTFFLTILFVSHRDLIRYSLPIIPFLFVAFKNTLEKKEFKYVFILLIIPVYLFSLAYISQNVMPISNWRPFL